MSERAELATRLIQEAEMDSGTWSFSMMKEVKTKLPRFKISDTRFLITHILHRMTQENSTDLINFKLSQMFSFIKLENAPFINEVINEHRSEIDSIVQKTQDKPLSEPTCKLLRSLIQTVIPVPQTPRPMIQIKSSTPSPEMMRGAFGTLNDPENPYVSSTPPPFFQ